MASPRRIVRNDFGETIAYDCTLIPDTVASATFTLTRIGASTPTIDKAEATFTANDDESGRVSYVTVDGDQDTAGRYRGEFELTLDNGSPMSYPAEGFIDIWIREDLA